VGQIVPPPAVPQLPLVETGSADREADGDALCVAEGDATGELVVEGVGGWDGEAVAA
jgi:hypothetical protein